MWTPCAHDHELSQTIQGGILVKGFMANILYIVCEPYISLLPPPKKKSNVLLGWLAIIISTSLLAGTITAFVGPIAFIGLAIPHLTRQVFNTSNHKILLPAVFLFGGIVMLICDTIAQVPNSDYTLPINAITSLVGAPVVIWLLLRKQKMIF